MVEEFQQELYDSGLKNFWWAIRNDILNNSTDHVVLMLTEHYNEVDKSKIEVILKKYNMVAIDDS